MALDHCLLMRKSLQQATPPPLWPPGVRLSRFDLAHAVPAYELLHATSADDLPDWPTWQAHWRGNPEYDADLCLLVMDDQGLVALLQGWTSGYIKDLAVHPRARRQGLGRALLAWAFATYRQRGEGSVDLRVREDNHAARRLYQQMHMDCLRREPC